MTVKLRKIDNSKTLTKKNIFATDDWKNYDYQKDIV